MAFTADPQLDRPGANTGAYQLVQPTLDDARTALRGLYGPHSNDIWCTLLARAGLTGQENDLDSFDRLVSFMRDAEPITQLCGRSLAVRSATYRQLAATPREQR
ncbi:hypothetical protein [Actinoplanes xinjiangensis]|uniref:hypothetical protein n=1 Tax=Actinoplanes xinjiangensis TaxID=512350 RepID=UPI00344347BF